MDGGLRDISKIKDGDSNYIFRPSIDDNGNGTLHGSPVTINADMADIATTTKPVLFGDFPKFVARQVGELKIMRLVEPWADFNQTGFIAFQGWDGGLRDAGTNPVKVLQMA